MKPKIKMTCPKCKMILFATKQAQCFVYNKNGDLVDILCPKCDGLNSPLRDRYKPRKHRKWVDTSFLGLDGGRKKLEKEGYENTKN